MPISSIFQPVFENLCHPRQSMWWFRLSCQKLRSLPDKLTTHTGHQVAPTNTLVEEETVEQVFLAGELAILEMTRTSNAELREQQEKSQDLNTCHLAIDFHRQPDNFVRHIDAFLNCQYTLNT